MISDELTLNVLMGCQIHPQYIIPRLHIQKESSAEADFVMGQIERSKTNVLRTLINCFLGFLLGNFLLLLLISLLCYFEVRIFS